MHPRVDRNLVLLFGALLVVVVLAAANRRREPGQGSLGAVVVSFVVSPLQRGLSQVGRSVRGFLGMLAEVRTLHSENQRLRAEVDRLNRRINALNERGLENVRLRQLLRFRETLPDGGENALPASVIGMKPTNWFNSIEIDAGANQGVREKQVVLAARGLVGQVRLVKPDTATVLLVTDLNSGAGARIQRSGWIGVVKGTAGPLLELAFLPREADVRRGDLVVTSGMGSVFRVRGIVIGTVESVRLDENTSVKTAKVRPAVDFQRLEEVLVLAG